MTSMIKSVFVGLVSDAPQTVVDVMKVAAATGLLIIAYLYSPEIGSYRFNNGEWDLDIWTGERSGIYVHWSNDNLTIGKFN